MSRMDLDVTFGGKRVSVLPGNLTDITCISGDESHCFAAQCTLCNVTFALVRRIVILIRGRVR